jgi:hypothetical protein
VNRCSVCGGEVRYFGGLAARDPATDEPHTCLLTPAPRALLCACELLVFVHADGARTDQEGAPHTHEAAPAQRVEQPIDSPPHPADVPRQQPQRKESQMPAPAVEPFTGHDMSIIIVEGGE